MMIPLLLLSLSIGLDTVVGQELKVAQIGHPLALLCNVTTDPVKWFKEETELESIDSAVISTDPHKLLINRITASDGGNYSCASDTGVKKIFSVEVEPFVKLCAKSANAIENEKFELKCEAAAYPQPVLSWLKDESPMDLFNTTFYSFTDDESGLPNAVLKIPSLREEDGGVYTCFAESNGLSANSTVLVRVIAKWAALCLFLVIVGLVIVLTPLIYLLQSCRSKYIEEKDDDQGKGLSIDSLIVVCGLWIPNNGLWIFKAKILQITKTPTFARENNQC